MVRAFIAEKILNFLVRIFIKNHPSFMEKLNGFYDEKIKITLTDLPFSALITLNPICPTVLVFKKTEKKADATSQISGSLYNLLLLAFNRLDGDALFFSRKLEITGKSDLAVALRNALDAEN